MMEFRPEKWYTKKQMKRFLSDKHLRDTVSVKDGIVQYEPTIDRVRITSYLNAAYQQAKGFDPTIGRGRKYRRPGNAREELQRDLPAIHKRTPQERVQSMMDRLVEEYKLRGKVPGADDPEVQAIVGEIWRYGVTDVTGEDIRQVAQYFLEKARKDQILQDAKRIVSTPGNDRVPEIK